MPILPDDHAALTETDAEFWTRLDHEAAVEKARLLATYPVIDPHQESHHEPYNPSPDDLAEMARWSQSVQEHDEALQTWLQFFGHEEREVSSFYVDEDFADSKRALLEDLCLAMLRTSLPTHGHYAGLERRQTLQSVTEVIRLVWQQQIASLKHSA